MVSINLKGRQSKNFRNAGRLAEGGRGTAAPLPCDCRVWPSGPASNPSDSCLPGIALRSPGRRHVTSTSLRRESRPPLVAGLGCSGCLWGICRGRVGNSECGEFVKHEGREGPSQVCKVSRARREGHLHISSKTPDPARPTTKTGTTPPHRPPPSSRAVVRSYQATTLVTQDPCHRRTNLAGSCPGYATRRCGTGARR
jgi:hypothetical protein